MKKQVKQLTKEQAIAFYNSEVWKDMSDLQIAQMQLSQQFLAVPFSVFHGSVEKVFGRPVYTHEFASKENLQREFLGDKEPPTFDEILALIPAGKQIFQIDL
jgi:hypothetical protein